MKYMDILVFAHRGYRAIAPENTLLSARKGFEAGADYLELDVAASRDGTLVVIHDDTLVRTTNAEAVFPERAPWIVYDFGFAELKRLDAGSWYARTDPFDQVKSGRVGPVDLALLTDIALPSLRELLELVRDSGRRVNVEIKDATGRPCDAWIVERTIDLIREAGVADRTVISSFNWDYLLRSKAAAPSIPIGALIEKNMIADPVDRLRRLGAASFNPDIMILDRAVTEEVRAAGFDIFVWTVNEKEDMRRLLDWGVTGLITDFPDRAIEVLGR
jgi:glycerophosphoryl diester phosphodiesterase